MILHGNQRGGYKDLALHLLKDENERIELFELRGFASDDLLGALQESYAISRATRCKQHLFSLSLNPPKGADVSARDFEAAIDQAEESLGLEGQPRAIVFHDKRGVDGELRRHAHAVWCRIDTQEMKAVQLSFTHKKLREVSRELFLAHGWRMPDGLIDSRNRDVRNMTLAEWQQAKRAGRNPNDMKALFQDCWSISDSRAAFAAALAEKGFVLAKGKRGHVAVDHAGEVYPVSRWTGFKAKEVRARLGDLNHLPDVETAQQLAAKIIAERLEALKAQEAWAAEAKQERATQIQKRLLARQSREAARLHETQTKRKASEEAQRNARLRTGILGFLDRLTGRRKRTLEDNRSETALSDLRDRRETEALRQAHVRTMDHIGEKAHSSIRPHRDSIRELDTDIGWLAKLPELAQDADHSPAPQDRKRRKRRSRSARSRDGPEP